MTNENTKTRTARTLTIIACCYFAIVTAVMLYYYLKPDPLNSPRMAALHNKMLADRGNVQLKEEIRELDLQLRRQFFVRQRILTNGAYLLTAGAILLVASLRYLSPAEKTTPRPPETLPDDTWDIHVVNRRSLMVASTAVVFSGLIVGLLLQTSVPWQYPHPDSMTLADATAEVVELARAPGEASDNWGRFRGPDGSGVSRFANAPRSWDMITGENVLWKTEVPLQGHSSPVVWEDRVFLTGADENQREIYCFDANTGMMIWRRSIPTGTGERPEPMHGTGYAASTPATDGERVYAIFATGDIASLDFAGNLIWSRNIGVPQNPYGHACSLLVHDGLLMVQYDHGDFPGDEECFIKALDVRTGEMQWKTPRPVQASWCTPIVIEVDGRNQLILSASPYLTAYDPAHGAELWRAEVVSGEAAPSPVFANDFVYVTTDMRCLAAVRVGGSGDVTETHVAWMQYDGLPDTCSPVTDGNLLFLVNSYGMLTCYDAVTGELLWDHDLEAEFYSSPSIAGDIVYVADRNGIVHLFKAAREYEPVGAIALGEEITSSPAFADGRIYFRGDKHLICIAESND